MKSHLNQPVCAQAPIGVHVATPKGVLRCREDSRLVHTAALDMCLEWERASHAAQLDGSTRPETATAVVCVRARCWVGPRGQPWHQQEVPRRILDSACPAKCSGWTPHLPAENGTDPSGRHQFDPPSIDPKLLKVLDHDEWLHWPLARCVSCFLLMFLNI